MKKIVLLFAIALIAVAANAQVTLSGTSYTQNFDALGSGLPAGWLCYNSATSTSLGTLDATFGTSTVWGAYYDTTNCPSDVFGTGFKNSASADVASNATATCTVQGACTNRCLAVRQSSATSHPGYDPGASFVFKMNSTAGCANLVLTFNLQSLDEISPRITTWTVDYGIGATPTTFVPVTPTSGTMTTGGLMFSNNAITVHFPAALNNVTSPVYIRISALAGSTGSGNRATSGIDDFSLTWTGTAGVVDVTAATELTVAAMGTATSENMNLVYTAANAGTYTLNVYDMVGHVVYTQAVNAVEGTGTVSVNGLHLANGMYIVKMMNESNVATSKVIVD
jgi:trimeric autotransporter adhesin